MSQRNKSHLRGVLTLLAATAAMVFVVSLPASLEIGSRVVAELSRSF